MHSQHITNAGLDQTQSQLNLKKKPLFQTSDQIKQKLALKNHALRKALKLLMRQHKPLPPKREPIPQRKADDRTHDRPRIIHRLGGDGQERRERQESHAVDPPGQPDDVDRHAPFSETPGARGWEAAFEAAHDDEGRRDDVGGVEAEGGEGGSVQRGDGVSMERFGGGGLEVGSGMLTRRRRRRWSLRG